ncbi:hypothetical protein C6P40_003555 [Pichia californica]|uniref:Vacuolar protein sorting-associated protein 75 n=1 Tax=Pichia californica TaxID=460514 RepID=A0A9P7BEI7_9ASCO|nr:hypothetical protein C6P40_003555 [[Candida] californica]
MVANKNNVEKSFLKLQKLEIEIQKADSQVEQFKNKIFTPIYEQRRKYLSEIPKFWYIVLAQHDDFQEYVSIDDMKYLELINDLYVEFWERPRVFHDDDNDSNNDQEDKIYLPTKGFSITFEFESGDNKDNIIKNQKIIKSFDWVIDPTTGSRKLESKPVKFEWPIELLNINPEIIKKKAKDENRKLSVDEKKRYRQGMRSFFSFFQWTGNKPGKEYRNGEELASLIAEDIFPAALDYYILAAPGINGKEEGGEDEEEEDDDDDEESGEELDLSDSEDSVEHIHQDLKRQKREE